MVDLILSKIPMFLTRNIAKTDVEQCLHLKQRHQIDVRMTHTGGAFKVL